MKNVLLSSLLVISFSAFASPFKSVNPLFYVVYKDGHMGFVLGTYHFLAVSELPEFVLGALKKTPLFVNEWSAESTAQASESRSNRSPSPAPTPETMQKLVQRGIPLSSLNRMPASGLCLSYLFWESYQKILAEGGSLDQNLEQLALAHHKKTAQLDSLMVGRAIDQNVARACDINSLVSKISPEQARVMQDRALENFRSGDFRRITNADEQNLAAVSERNRVWVNRIEQLLPETPFVAVGAGHLAGRQGLLNLLASDGYIVRRIHSEEELEAVLPPAR